MNAEVAPDPAVGPGEAPPPADPGERGPQEEPSRPSWLWDAGVLAVGSALAVLAAATILLVVAGRDVVSTPATAARTARTASLLFVPGIAVALVTRGAARRARSMAAIGTAMVLAAVALWRRDQGGLALLPAAVLLALAAAPSRPSNRAAVPSPARTDLVVAGAVTGLLGVLGRAVTTEDAGDTLTDVLNVAASGLVLLAWPLLASVLLPARLRHRALVAAAAGLVAAVVVRAPAGGEAWLVPGLVLTLLAALSHASGDEGGKAGSEPQLPIPADQHAGSRPATPRWAWAPPDRTLVGLAAGVAVLLTLGLAVSGVMGRSGPSGGELALDAVAATVPAAAAAWLLHRPSPDRSRLLTLGLATAGLAVTLAGIDDRPGAAALAVPPVMVLVACRPELTAPPARWARPATDAALGALLLTGLLASPGTPGSGSPLQVTGGRLDDGDEAIAVADARFLTDTLGLADRGAGARCYFIQERDLYADEIACGPVVHPSPTDRNADEDQSEVPEDHDEPRDVDQETGDLPGPGTWDVYPTRVVNGSLLLVGEPALGREVHIDLLHRPDGLRPPSHRPEGDTGLTVHPGFATGLSDEPGNTRPAGGTVLAGNGQVTVETLAEPSTVVDGDGRDLRAPDGYQLVAFELSFDDVAGTSVEVLSDRDRIDITGIVTDSSDDYDDGWVVAVDRDDGIDPLLEVTYRGRSQRISLATGDRIGGHPLLYQPRSQTIEIPVERATVPVTVPAPVPHQAEVRTSGYEIAQAHLVVFEENLGWAPPGRAWLTIDLSDLENPSFSDARADTTDDPTFRFDATRSFSLRTPDGSILQPSAARPTADTDLVVAFAVPETTTNATFRSGPRWLMVLGGQGIEVTAPAIEVALSL